MNKIEISKGRHQQLAAAFRAGREKAAKTSGDNAVFREIGCMSKNPYNDRDGGMPEAMASLQGSLWYSWNAGVLREVRKISGASTMLRSARFLMRRAIDLGRI